MTIPIIPGPFSSLGQGLNQGVQAYQQQQLIQYEQARQGLNTILQLMQAGALDPAMLGAPEMSKQFAAAKIPQPEAGSIFPSVAGARARTQTDIMQGKDVPLNARQAAIAQVPSDTAVRQDQVGGLVAGEQLRGLAQGGAVGRAVSGVPSRRVAEGAERALEAVPAAGGHKFYIDTAAGFIADADRNVPRIKDPAGHQVIDANALADAAFAAASQNQQYAPMIQNGELTKAHFATAARMYAALDEEGQQRWLTSAARSLAADREERLTYTSMISGYNQSIQQKQDMIKQAADEFAKADLPYYLTSAQAALARGDTLTARHRSAIEGKAKIDSLRADANTVIQERNDIADRYGMAKLGMIPDPLAPVERRTTRDSAAAAEGRRPPAGVTAPGRVTPFSAPGGAATPYRPQGLPIEGRGSSNVRPAPGARPGAAQIPRPAAGGVATSPVPGGAAALGPIPDNILAKMVDEYNAFTSSAAKQFWLDGMKQNAPPEHYAQILKALGIKDPKAGLKP